MKHKIRNIFLVSFLIALFVFSFFSIVHAEEEKKDGYFTVYEEGTNRIIFRTSIFVSVGDQYLDEENRLYEVTEVKGDMAYAKFKEKVDIEKALQANENDNIQEAFKEAGQRVIAIYHTHSDESYVPTDGKASIPYRGGIFKVGEALKRALEQKGVKVIHSEKPHDPHDAGAYHRSRRTAMELLKQRPDAILDVHRDAVPAEEYIGSVNGRPVAQVRLVVGRQNPQIKMINNFAWQIKAMADKKYPGLLKGIFYGKGSYNQDLYPRTILIEAGTYTNHREKAEEGIQHLADVIMATVYGADYQKEPTPMGRVTQIPGEKRSSGGTIFWIIFIAVLGIIGYMIISTGGWNEFKSKIKKFGSSEFSNFLGNISISKNKKSTFEEKSEDGNDENFDEGSGCAGESEENKKEIR